MPETVVYHHLQCVQSRVVSVDALGILRHHFADQCRRRVHILRNHTPSDVIVRDDAGQTAVGIQQQCRICSASGHLLGHLQDRAVVGDGHRSFGSQFRYRLVNFIGQLALRMEWRVHDRCRPSCLRPCRLA